ncbi:MAG: A/G-specific adenine glycosylase [bacterium]
MLTETDSRARFLPAPRKPQLQADLLRWYRASRRDLPWRRTADPYRIWVSEVLLQQTRVETATAYYERFLERFPSLAHLARASIEEVLLVWQGLGYYGRARSLHRAARIVMTRHGGKIPRDAGDLERLPGIGPYTARAVSSIAFGRAVAALDGNAMRVLCRLLGLSEDPRRPQVRTGLQRTADSLLPRGDPSAFNQAMMELGALVCTPARPRCPICPLRTVCQALHRDQVLVLPTRARKPKTPLRHAVVAAAWYRGRLLFRKRPPEGLLAGLWELPGTELDHRKKGGSGAFQSLWDSLRGFVSLERIPCRSALTVRHSYTHFREELEVIPCRAQPVQNVRSPRGELGYRWIHPNHLHLYPMTGATRKILKLLGT